MIAEPWGTTSTMEQDMEDRLNELERIARDEEIDGFKLALVLLLSAIFGVTALAVMP